jgi:ribosomal protein S25
LHSPPIKPLTPKAMQELKVITAKTLASQMGVHLNTARSYMKDIKQEYDIKVVCLDHINQYFKISAKKAQ